MAGIGKLGIIYYGDFKEFVVWCIKHNPSLLDYIYEPFLSSSEWYEMQDKWKKIIVAEFRIKQDRFQTIMK